MMGKEKKMLGFFSCLSLVIGNMFGSSVYVLPALLAPYGSVGLLAWMVAAIGVLSVSIIFAKLPNLIKLSGGPYAYTSYCFGNYAAFLVVWCYWIGVWTGNAAIAIIFSNYLIAAFPALSDYFLVIAISAIWFFTIINCTNVQSTAITQCILTLLKIIPVFIILVFGLVYIKQDVLSIADTTQQSIGMSIGSAYAIIWWGFIGMESASVASDEVEDPDINIPLSTCYGVLIVLALYVLTTVIAMSIMPNEQLQNSISPLSDIAYILFGQWGVYLATFGAIISCLGSINGWIFLQGQAPMSAARDGIFPTVFGMVSENGRPIWGMVISSLLITGIILLNQARPDLFEFIALISIFTTLVSYMFCMMAYVLYYVNRNEISDFPSIFSLGFIGFLSCLLAVVFSQSEVIFIGTVLMLFSIPIFVIIQWQSTLTSNIKE